MDSLNVAGDNHGVVSDILPDDVLSDDVRERHPLVWVVIPTWNRCDDLLACLTSVSDLRYTPLEILVVDNASQDDTVAAVRDAFPDVHLLILDRNAGATGASNRGFTYALERGADFVFRLDSDTLLDPACLLHLVEAALMLPNAGVLAPKIYFADRPDVIWFAGASAHRWHFGATNVGRNQEDYAALDDLRTVDYVWSTGVLINRDVLFATSGFDEDFLVYFEEVDFCLRVHQAGFLIYYVPAARMWHKVGSESRSPWIARQWNRSKILLYRKHSRGLHRWLLIGYAVAYALFRAIRPKPGKGNRGPLLDALRGMREGLLYSLHRD